MEAPPNPTVRRTWEIVREARRYLQGRHPPEDRRTLLADLRRHRQYELARQVIARIRQETPGTISDEELAYQEAYCFLKDEDLSDRKRWESAKQSLSPLKDEQGWKSTLAQDLAEAIEREQGIHEARIILKNPKNYRVAELVACAKRMKGYNAFTYARRLFTHAGEQLLPAEQQLAAYLRQQRALCTYKDPDLPLIQRLNQALHILNGSEETSDGEASLDHLLEQGYLSRYQAPDPETLGLAGAIFKRKWDAEGRTQDLERAIDFYRRGHDADMQLVNVDDIATAGEGTPTGRLEVKVLIQPGHKFGYPGINAAFTLDLLAHHEDRAGGAAVAGEISSTATGTPTGMATSQVCRQKALEIRTDLARYLSALVRFPQAKLDSLRTERGYEEWWVRMTLVEAFFGLRQYAAAEQQLASVSQATEPWQFEASVRQLVKLAELQGVDLRNADDRRAGSDTADPPGQHPGRNVLQRFLQGSLTLDNVLRGKVGLALSGGGFRASFFHIGVLAKLAELDLLRHVEVLSCVSGGAIVGAHYYLEVRRLLQSQPDGAISQQQYIEIVQRLVERFRKGTQKNLRMRLLRNPITNLKMLLFPTYSRSVRAGELYEQELYSQVEDGEGPERWLNDLFIEPAGDSLTFQPKLDNWRRQNQVPILVLNATTLNTGNNWQFTASWMGEPPPPSDEELDGRTRLRRTYYREAPKHYRRVRLGLAVASSACVPGIFEPLLLTRLYPDCAVRLVDGGVHDNQGVGSLLEQDCGVILLSDACGQVRADKQPFPGAVGPLLRSSDVTMQRVRDAQFREIDVRRRTGLLSTVMTVHLRKELNPQLVDWIDCPDPSDGGERTLPKSRRSPNTSYHVLRTIQQCLSATRTDLDSFSDAEAFALMTSGYLMTEQTAKRTLHRLVPEPRLTVRAPFVGWDFLKVEDAMRETTGVGDKYLYLKRILEVSQKRTGKVLALRPWATLLALIPLLAVLIGLGWGLLLLWRALALR